MTLLARRALSLLTASALLAGLFLGAPASVRATPQTYYVGDPGWLYDPGSPCEDPDYWKDGDWTGGGAYNSDNDAIQDAGDNAASGSVIYICAGTYNFTEVVTVSAGKNLTFRGDGDQTVLDGTDNTRIFNASPVNESDQGGVLSLRDMLIMDAEVTEWNAGAVVADGLSLDNVTITRTQGAYNGGALYAEGDVTIVDSTFTDNIATADGGVLYAWNGARTVSISNSVFDGNFAGSSGGVIVAATLTITGSAFIDNDAGYGGAISATTVAVTNSTFTNNDASGSGGAISATNATITNSTFTDSDAFSGGAINTDGTTVITASTFTGNDAGSYGGAIYASTATIARSRFTLNSAGEHGGAINLYGPTHQDLRKWRRNTFSRNTATLGGAVTLGSCEAPNRSEAARVERANSFFRNRATEQRRTRNIELRVGDCA